MTDLDEEARAQLWRQQQANRAATSRARAAGRAGSSSARVALASRWAGFRDWLTERRTDEPEEQICDE